MEGDVPERERDCDTIQEEEESARSRPDETTGSDELDLEQQGSAPEPCPAETTENE